MRRIARLRLRPPSSRCTSARAGCRSAAPARAAGRSPPTPASPSTGRSRTASGCSAARPISSAMSIANRAGSQLAAEHLLERETGRPRLGAEPGRPPVRQRHRRGARTPATATASARTIWRRRTISSSRGSSGAVPPGATCNWSFDDGTIPPKQVNAPCAQPVQQRLAYGKPTIAAVGITRPDNSVDSVSAEIEVHDLLIAGMGDSVAAGEGNPDRPIALADEGFCFRRFLGAARGEYFRPSRLGYKGDKACDDSTAGSAASTTDWNSHGARWMSAACHRSLYGYQLRTALALAIENPQNGRHLPAARVHRSDDRERPVRLARRQRLPAAGTLRRHGAAAVRTVAGHARQGAQAACRAASSTSCCSRSAPTTSNSPASSPTSSSAPASSARCSIRAASLRPCRRRRPSSIANFPTISPSSATALKPLVGGNLSRVVYVSYGHPAMQGDAPCPGGRDGLDIHPAFTADDTRLKNVTDFVLTKFLPKVKALARCEAGPKCANPDTDRMTFVDSHQAEFANHGICARSHDDPRVRPRVLLARGQELRARSGGGGDLAAGLSAAAERISSLRAARTLDPHRQRQLFHGDDLSARAVVDDAAEQHPRRDLGRDVAVYGGAFHPSAEGHAVMADAALPAVARGARPHGAARGDRAAAAAAGGQIAPPQ